MLHMIQEFNLPKLWKDVSHHLLSDRRLNLRCMLTTDTLEDLVYLLSKGQANTTTTGYSKTTDVV